MQDLTYTTQDSLKPSRNSLKYRFNGTTKEDEYNHVEDSKETSDFSAEQFVDSLLCEGSIITCDRTSSSFTNNTNLPPYYDEDLYRRGQKFFYKHFFGLAFGKVLGVLTLLASPIAKILLMTDKSSTPLTAYRRYLGTIFHLLVWYDNDVKSNSSTWSSIRKVRNMHNLASSQSTVQIKYPINQKDMAITLFGFMGLGVVRSEMIGVHNTSKEELKGFIHLWRVVGYLMGIEDRFNICRESVKETKEICNLLIERVILPFMNNPVAEFDSLSRAFIEGMEVVNPMVDYDVYMHYVHMILENTVDINLREKQVKLLSSRTKTRLNHLMYIMWALQFSVVRSIFNCLQSLIIWFLRVYPFRAYAKFGKKHSHVSI